MTLEAHALHFLKWDKACVVAMFQRGPRRVWGSVPDVIGVTKARYIVEVEIKRTVADFKADADKPHILHRELHLKRWPKQFYYMLPMNLAARIEVPDWAGLVGVDLWRRNIIKVAPMNLASQKLSIKDCIKLFRLLGNQFTLPR